MKIENWNGHQIRFVEVDGEWWGVSSDIASALDYRDASNMLRHIPDKYKGTQKVSTLGGNQSMTVLTEFGIYKAIFNSHKSEAEQFQKWVFNVFKQLRQSTGLEGFEVFRMMDKQHQKDGLKRPVRVNLIKANTVANKAISTRYG